MLKSSHSNIDSGHSWRSLQIEYTHYPRDWLNPMLVKSAYIHKIIFHQYPKKCWLQYPSIKSSRSYKITSNSHKFRWNPTNSNKNPRFHDDPMVKTTWHFHGSHPALQVLKFSYRRSMAPGRWILENMAFWYGYNMLAIYVYVYIYILYLYPDIVYM